MQLRSVPDDIGGSNTQRHFDIFVAPGFVLLELASLVEVVRLANRVYPFPPFTFSFCSLKGGPIESSSNATVSTSLVTAPPGAD